MKGKRDEGERNYSLSFFQDYRRERRQRESVSKKEIILEGEGGGGRGGNKGRERSWRGGVGRKGFYEKGLMKWKWKWKWKWNGSGSGSGS